MHTLKIQRFLIACLPYVWHINGLIRKRCNSIANGLGVQNWSCNWMNQFIFVLYQAITWTNDYILSVKHSGMNLSAMWIKILQFLSVNMCSKRFAKCWSVCRGLNVLNVSFHQSLCQVWCSIIRDLSPWSWKVKFPEHTTHSCRLHS